MTRPAKLLSDWGLLSWPTALMGYRRGWARPDEIADAATLALEREQASVDSDLAVLTAAQVLSDREIRESLALLAAKDPDRASEAALLRRWMLAALVQVQRSNSRDAEKLDHLEKLYAEFGYPEELRYISRYNTRDAERERRPEAGDKLESPLDAMNDAVTALSTAVGAPDIR